MVVSMQMKVMAFPLIKRNAPDGRRVRVPGYYACEGCKDVVDLFQSKSYIINQICDRVR